MTAREYLQFLCDKYNLDYRKKGTMNPLVQKLYCSEKNRFNRNEKYSISGNYSVQMQPSRRNNCKK